MEVEQGSPFESDVEEQELDTEEEGEIEEDDSEIESDEDDSDEDLEDDGEEESDELGEATDEEIDDILDELEESKSAEVDTVPHAALHKERMKRKELQAEIGGYRQHDQELQSKIDEYEKSFEKIEEQLKEYGLEGSIDFNKPKDVDPEVLQMRQEKQAQATEHQMETAINELRSEASDFLGEYPMIDGASKEQEQLIIGLSLSAHILGAEKEDAVEYAMKLVSSLITQEKKAAVRKPAKSRKRVVGTKSNGSRKPKSQREFFDNLASSFG